MLTARTLHCGRRLDHIYQPRLLDSAFVKFSDLEACQTAFESAPSHRDAIIGMAALNDTDIGENPAELGEASSDEEVSFSPSERRLVTQPLDLSVQTLADQWNDSMLILPDIQREYVWDTGKASRLVESLLLNIPIPVLYFAENEESRYEIFDGHQRTRSIIRFLNNEFRLTGLAVLSEYKGKRFFELPERDQRFFRMRTLRVILISIDSHPNMKFEIYERLNTGSILLNAQELRNSIYRGPLNELLHQLARSPVFRSLIGTKAPRTRMVDEEILLRFFAMRHYLDQYRPSLKRFLNEYSAQARKFTESDIVNIRSDFFRTIGSIHQFLGDKAFRILDIEGDRVDSTVNRALFEAQMLAFSWIKEPTHGLSEFKVVDQISALFSDDAFVDAIQRATGDRARTLRRVRDTVAALVRSGLEVKVPFKLAP